MADYCVLREHCHCPIGTPECGNWMKEAPMPHGPLAAGRGLAPTLALSLPILPPSNVTMSGYNFNQIRTTCKILEDNIHLLRQALDAYVYDPNIDRR